MGLEGVDGPIPLVALLAEPDNDRSASVRGAGLDLLAKELWNANLVLVPLSPRLGLAGRRVALAVSLSDRSSPSPSG